MTKYYLSRGFKNDLKKQVARWKQYAEGQVAEYENRFVDILGEVFVERARQNLLNYDSNTSKYVGNIYYDPRWKQVVVRSPQGNEPDLMWYLEFGTGIAGEKNPHPKANESGWRYAINKGTVNQAGSAWRTKDSHNDGIGWFVQEDKDSPLYHAKDDHTNYKRPIFFTSGIPPARYIYNTMLQIDELIELAKQKMNAERK